MFHIVVSLSAHGFGHIGQTAPVIREILRSNPDLEVTLRTSAPEYKLIEHFGRQLPVQQVSTDVGMIQASALEVDLQKTADAYADFHRDWHQKVAREARELIAAKPDLVLVNISYLTLAAAAYAGIPAIALGNINWADIYADLFGDLHQESQTILQQMRAAYDSAAMFLQPAPSIPMTMLHNGRGTGPIAQQGKSRRQEIFRRLNLQPGTRLVLISLGGMELRPPIEQWARLQGLHLLVPASWNSHHPDISPVESLEMPFIDVLASSDALIAKPGYGSFVEAACNGIPVLYLPRYKWPEAPHLISWLSMHGRCLAVEKASFMEGCFKNELDRIWSQAVPDPPLPTGIEESAGIIQQFLLEGSVTTAQ